jgi:WD40 repeat protein
MSKIAQEICMFLLCLVMWAGSNTSVLAADAVNADPTLEPLLRIETGMHTSLIRRVVADLPRDRLVTCSDDKTIRVWQMPQARLVSTLRLPIDRGHEGQVFAIAISPDGQTVAAGGWTGWTWDHEASIYFFDVESGELVRRRGGFGDGVSSLAWSRDGKHLIVGLQGRSGLHLLRISDLAIVTSDPNYNDKVTEIDQRSDGLIAAVGLDGIVRLYNQRLKIVARRAMAREGKAAVSVRFSPDGSLLAVAFLDTPQIAVLNAGDLSFAFHPSIEPPSRLRNFLTVAWSSDGRYLHAGGDCTGEGRCPLYRWGSGGRGVADKIPIARNRITDIQQFSDGAIAFCSEDPSVGLIGPDSKIVVLRGSDIIDFSRAQTRLEVSSDGGVIRYAAGLNASASFPALHRGDDAVRAEPRQRTWPPLTESAGISVRHWKDSTSPSINGYPVILNDYETTHRYAIGPDHKSVLFGTEWALRLVDKKGGELWTVGLPAVALDVNIARSGMLAVAALSDGTIRWYRMRDGKEILAYFPHMNGRDWIAWVPDGYYTSSAYGDNFVGWHLNRGRDLTPDFYRAVQFDRVFYRPDIVKDRLDQIIEQKTRAIECKRVDPTLEISQLREIAPPRVKVKVGKIQVDQRGHAYAELDLQADKTRQEIKDVSIFVNSIPALTIKERRLAESEPIHYKRSIKVPLFAPESVIRVEAFNGTSIGVAETAVSLATSANLVVPTGRLYILAIGANSFPNLSQNSQLRFAASDAEEIARILELKSKKYYRKVVTEVVTDNMTIKPTYESVKIALKFVQQAEPEDTVIIFLASHGISDPAGNYFFVPSDVAREDIEKVASGIEPRALVSWFDFFETLRVTPGRRLLIVDTCHAQSIDGKVETHALLKRSASALFTILVASKSNELSQEYKAGRHGLFTYALIKSLESPSDTNRDGLISIEEVFEATTRTVSELRDSRIPQTPQLVLPPSQRNRALLPADPGASQLSEDGLKTKSL